MTVINSSVELLVVVNRVTNKRGFCQFLLDQLSCLDVIVNTWIVDLLILVLDDHGQCKENSSDIMICYFFLVCLLNAFVTTK